MRTATTAEPIAHAILELESLMRPAALSPSWGSQAQPRHTGAPDHKVSSGRRAAPKLGKAPAVATASKSGRLKRAASAASGMWGIQLLVSLTA